ncbi:hypothetical protein BV394_07405 [Brevirhabdus pacifica]|uniref:Uncharacterized protein n=1 Tax=Brevirhabdus pacifica TaxID=1267768 RepID=A0A1U7DHX2_9RHOB|nr:hypothetical protein [Brevirhabdus pacifica]APX89561.1 hypothetical protein BV394_07405 [Brevirhabdus pacifica]OWU76434.1 hypothetical protein ATO5_08890 [Loktanella sp. 22II-4b]PJJ85775.1 hypothetical protein CLV77_0304 [Brevirhabdus pacifica]
MVTDRNRQTPPLFGGRDGAGENAISATEIVAAILSFVWVALVFVYLYVIPPASGEGGNPATTIMIFVAIFLPLALIWVAAVAARTSRMMKAESARLQASIDALRNAYVVQSHSNNASLDPGLTRKIEQLVEAQRATEEALAMFHSVRSGERPMHAPLAGTPVAGAAGKPHVDQPSLALGTPAEDLGVPISIADFIKAMNFPEDANDREGFRALRLALADRRIATLIRASEDLLTLLSQDGIYMDDLRPDRARPEVWRRFAKGERGKPVAALAGVRDRSSLALTSGRMKSDAVFRDVAHHFLRQFDRSFVEFEKGASDQDIAALAETRTARAFMLVGRVSGTFD